MVVGHVIHRAFQAVSLDDLYNSLGTYKDTRKESTKRFNLQRCNARCPRVYSSRMCMKWYDYGMYVTCKRLIDWPIEHTFSLACTENVCVSNLTINCVDWGKMTLFPVRPNWTIASLSDQIWALSFNWFRWTLLATKYALSVCECEWFMEKGRMLSTLIDERDTNTLAYKHIHSRAHT